LRGNPKLTLVKIVIEQKSQAIQHLLIIEDEKGKRTITLKSATCSIGRDLSSSIILHSNQISRQHAILLRTTVPETDGYLFRLIDGNLQGKRSTNGIVVNGQPCTSHDLNHGDEIVFGGEVRARYYTSMNPTDIEFLTSCESQDMSGFLSTLQNPFETLDTISGEDLKASKESALIRLASFPELFTYPIFEITLKGIITYSNPAANAQFSNLKKLGLQHPLVTGIINQVQNTQETFFTREVQVDQKTFEQSVHYIAESDLIRSYIIEITERKLTEKALEKAYSELESRVQARTAELQQANLQLQAEIIERRRSEGEVHYLQAISQAVNASKSFNEALHVALSMICEAADWEFGEAWIPSEDGSHLKHIAGWCQETPALQAAQQISKQFTFGPNEGLPGRVWISQKSEWLQSLGQQPETVFVRRNVMIRARLQTGVGIPIVAEGEVISVMAFFMSAACAENIQKIKFVSSIAIQIGSLMYRKRAEDSLHASMATNRALVNAMPDWMFRLSTEGVFINFAESKNSALPLLTSVFLGKRIADVLPLEIAASLMGCIDKTLESEEVQVAEYQLEIDDKTIDYEARITCSVDHEVIAIIRDITERKRAEAAILEDLEKERDLNELKSQFVSMTSHEFRTPLASILASAELLEHYRHRWSEEKNLGHLKRIQSSVLHMTDLLNDVLLIGQAEAGKIEYKPTATELVEFCDILVAELQITTDSHTIDFQHDGQCQVIHADQKLLRHILGNLLSNAVKYSPEGGMVRLHLSCDLNEAILIIQDEGIGIPKSEHANMFRSFNRASNVGNISGSGLGLAIVKKAIDLHEGTISFKSEVGVGTTFTVRLPLGSSQLEI
jgi:signal transduction histidine kinase/pSer/pThr/pTyr-binding forkhead associated (FHA) protein